jgi:hypothetical protein
MYFPIYDINQIKLDSDGLDGSKLRRRRRRRIVLGSTRS